VVSCRGPTRLPHTPPRGDHSVPLRALHPDTSTNAIGLKAMHELHAAVRDAEGICPVVIDSDLLARPEATMAAYCAAVGLPFIPRALTWERGERSEWRRTARWHADVSASSGSKRRERVYTHTVENSGTDVSLKLVSPKLVCREG
jgi:hypothetical protein